MAKRKTVTEWEKLLISWEESGETQAVFCRKNTISLSIFGYRLKREKDNAKDNGFTKGPLANKEP